MSSEGSWPGSSASGSKVPWPGGGEQEELIERKILGSVLPRLTNTVISMTKKTGDDTAGADSGLSEMLQVLRNMPAGGKYAEVVELTSGLCELEKRWRGDREDLATAGASVVRLQSETQTLKDEAKDLQTRNESFQQALSESLQLIDEMRCVPSF